MSLLATYLFLGFCMALSVLYGDEAPRWVIVVWSCSLAAGVMVPFV
jgi:hypothetical protein